jgi:hypothetical protein
MMEVDPHRGIVEVFVKHSEVGGLTGRDAADGEKERDGPKHA